MVRILASRLVALIWSEIKPIFIPQTYYRPLMRIYEDKIPRKDLAIFTAALVANVDYLISENREFLKKSGEVQDVFKCLTPKEFIDEINL